MAATVPHPRTRRSAAPPCRAVALVDRTLPRCAVALVGRMAEAFAQLMGASAISEVYPIDWYVRVLREQMLRPYTRSGCGVASVQRDTRSECGGASVLVGLSQ